MENLRLEQMQRKQKSERAVRRHQLKLVEKRKQMQRVQRLRNAQMAKKLTRLLGNEKKLQKDYDEVVSKCQIMEQQLKEVQHEKEKLVTKFNALADRVLTQQSLIYDDKKVL